MASGVAKDCRPDRAIRHQCPSGKETVGGSHRGEFICDGKFSNSLSLVAEYCVLRDHNCAEIFNRNYFDYMFQLIRLPSLECFD